MQFRSATAACVALLLLAQPALACSKGTFSWGIRSSDAFFIGVATADTLLAGPGNVNFRVGSESHGRPDGSSVYGQRIRVERIGGPAAQQLPDAVREVVVVPWGYDPSCRPVPWSQSARWVAPEARGLYVAELRSPEHWVDGQPTFDLHNPWHLPYTAAERIREMEPEAPLESLLSPEQVFDLFRHFPSAAAVQGARSESLTMLRQWVSAHPDLARRPPADMLLSGVLSTVANVELQDVDHPVLGTWRFTLQVPGDSAYTFYARTESHPVQRWSPSRTGWQSAPGELWIPPAEGYSFLTALARRPEQLPDSRPRRDYPMSYMFALANPEEHDGDQQRWQGMIEASMLQRAFPADARFQGAVEHQMQEFGERHRQNSPYETPAHFVRDADGVLRVRQEFPVPDGPPLVLEGEQISRQTHRVTQ